MGRIESKGCFALDSLILDNPVFNVKGQGKEMLLKTMELGVACVGNYKLTGFTVDNKKGIILYWSDSDKKDYQQFVEPGEPKDIIDQIFDAIYSFNLALEKEDDEFWDLPINDYEVGNSLGWRMYTEQWGQIGDDWRACLAIVPSYLWIGK